MQIYNFTVRNIVMECAEIKEFEIISLRGGENREGILSIRGRTPIQYLDSHVLVIVNCL